METGNEVAIKLLRYAIECHRMPLHSLLTCRNNEHMKRAGKKEIEILKALRESDPDGKYNNITLLNDFQDRDHLCLVFEPMVHHPLTPSSHTILSHHPSLLGHEFATVAEEAWRPGYQCHGHPRVCLQDPQGAGMS